MAEFTGAYLALVKVMVSAELVARVRSRHVLISVDNTEVYHVMQIFCVGGLATVEELAVVTSILFCWSA